MSYPARYLRCSNLLSYLSLLSSLLAVIVAREWSSWEYAGILLATSAFADTFDGRFARLFSRSEPEKAFGAQLDSLIDAVAFGIVPVVCLQSLTAFTSISTQIAWTAAAFIYLVCALTRLGYYNLQSDTHSGFIGLPTTLAALFWSTVFLTHPSVIPTILMLVFLGAAMVSSIPISRPRGLAMWAYMLWFMAVFVFYGFRLAHRG
jgi:CDP-diacylglycerol---serine O-phosphatidyltransferase